MILKEDEGMVEKLADVIHIATDNPKLIKRTMADIALARRIIKGLKERHLTIVKIEP